MRQVSKVGLAGAVIALSIAAAPFFSGSPFVPGGPAPSAEAKGAATSTVGKVPSEGAFTCDLTMPSTMPLDQVAPIIERDRMFMARAEGMRNKHLPLRIDPASGNLQSGGRYLFDTEEHAQDYKTFVENYTLDGVKFLERPYFIEKECHAWSTVAAYDFTDVHTGQVIVRTERWQTPAGNQRQLLKGRWPALFSEAQQRGLTSVWLLYNKQEHLVSLVYYADRIGPRNDAVPDFGSLAALESSQPLGHHLDGLGWPRSFDRTQWVLTTWFPFVAGDHGEPSLWPHSPPLPQPGPGDGVCEVSRGENAGNSGGDCPARCGDGAWEAGENNFNCPGDSPLPVP